MSYIDIKDDTIKKELGYFVSEANKLKKFSNKEISKHLDIIPSSYINENSISFEDGNIISIKLLVDIKIGDFDTLKHKYTYKKNKAKEMMLIDDMPCFGLDITLPIKELKKVRLIFFKLQVILPDSALFGLYEPNIYLDSLKTIVSCKVYRSKDLKRVYIYMLNGEGKNQYEVTWVLINSNYSMRIINRLPNL